MRFISVFLLLAITISHDRSFYAMDSAVKTSSTVDSESETFLNKVVGSLKNYLWPVRDTNHSLIYLFLHDESAYKKATAALTKDIKRLLAAYILRNHTIPNDICARLAELCSRERNTNTDKKGKEESIKIVTHDGCIELYNSENKKLFSFEHGSEILYLALNPSQERLLTLSHRSCKLWDVNSGILLAELTHEEGAQFFSYPIQRVVFNRTGDVLITGNRDTVRTWNARSGELISAPGEKHIIAFELNPRDEKILTLSEEGIVKVWNSLTWDSFFLLNAEERLTQAEFNGDGSRILTCSINGEAVIWDVASGVSIVKIPDGSHVLTANYNPRADHIITTSKRKFKIWDVVSGRSVATILSAFKRNFISARWSSLGDKIIAKMENGELIEWDMNALNIMQEVTQWFQNECTLEQAILLNCLNETGRLYWLLKNRGQRTLICFDFERYPHLLNHFKTMPLYVQEIVKEIVKLPKYEQS